MDKLLLNRAGIDEVAKILSRMGFDVSPLHPSSGAHLLITKGGKQGKITVRAKQKIEWPAVKGTTGKDHFILLVDFEKKSTKEVPDFYILSHQDFKATADTRVRQVIHRAGRSTYPVAQNLEGGTPTWLTEVVKASGKNYEGISLRPNLVKCYQNKWETITNYMEKPPNETVKPGEKAGSKHAR